MTGVVIALCVVVGLLGLLVVGLLRSHAEILRALHDLGVNLEDGTTSGARVFRASDARDAYDTEGGLARPRPGIEEAVRPTDSPESLGRGADLMGVTPSGDAVAVAVGTSPGLTLVAFLSSGCLTCEEFWRAFGRREHRRPGGLDARVVIATHGPDQESPARVADLAPAEVTTVMSSEAYDDYGVPISPYFVLVEGPDQRIVGEGAAASWVQLDGLLAKAAADAGLAGNGVASRRALLGGRARARRVDDELEAAGIGPGHSSLYPEVQLPEQSPESDLRP